MSNSSDFVTNFGKTCNKMVREYAKNLYRFYDEMTGCILIPKCVYDENEVFQDEVVCLLSKEWVKNDSDNYNNWCLEITDAYFEDVDIPDKHLGDKDEDGLIRTICVRMVESFC